MITQSNAPLVTLERVVGLIFWVMVVLAGAVVVGTLANQSSVPGVNAEVCVSARGNSLGFDQGSGRGSGRGPGPVGLDEGITWRAQEIQVCEPDPSAATALLGGAGLLVWLAPLVFFGLLRRLLRSARRDGAFADTIPGGLRQLGRFLLGWAAASFVVSGFVSGALLTRMTDRTVFFSVGDLPLLLVLLGIAFLALERVIAEAVSLREDSEGTI